MGDHLFERACFVENVISNAIDQSFGNGPLVTLDAADFNHLVIVPQGYNPPVDRAPLHESTH
jgi:hypothetical protein